MRVFYLMSNKGVTITASLLTFALLLPSFLLPK
jgi:hypothetical protein